MRQAEPGLSRRTATRFEVTPALLQGWGGGPRAAATQLVPGDIEAARAAVEHALALQRSSATGAGTAIARGLGRSYGDAAQLRDGLVIDTRRLKAVELDAQQGLVTAAAGVTIGELLARCVPAGWMVPVVPGTQHVTLGGAVASDIHGKNHGSAGTFGSHVEELGLLSSEGELLELRPGDELFAATLGGMGLTGVIAWVRLRLRSVTSPLLLVDTDRVSGWDQAFAALQAPGGPHRVAWLDLLASTAGRGIVTRAEHLERTPPGLSGSATVQARATVPTRWPGSLLRPLTVRAFNELRFRRSPVRARGRIEGIGAHMFPLDALEAWPRLYGRTGFTQYQLAVPPGQETVMPAVVERLRRAGVPCYLAVLKDFGAASGAPLSFPIEGWTLALDLPLAAPGIAAALDSCDELVAEAGGRVYLAKDARLRQDMMRAMYPRLARWQELRERADPERLWCSDLALRVGLVPAP